MLQGHQKAPATVGLNRQPRCHCYRSTAPALPPARSLVALCYRGTNKRLLKEAGRYPCYRSTAPALPPARSPVASATGAPQGACWRPAGAIATGAPHRRCHRRAAWLRLLQEDQKAPATGAPCCRRRHCPCPCSSRTAGAAGGQHCPVPPQLPCIFPASQCDLCFSCDHLRKCLVDAKRIFGSNLEGIADADHGFVIIWSCMCRRTARLARLELLMGKVRCRSHAVRSSCWWEPLESGTKVGGALRPPPRRCAQRLRS